MADPRGAKPRNCRHYFAEGWEVWFLPRVGGRVGSGPVNCLRLTSSAGFLKANPARLEGPDGRRKSPPLEDVPTHENAALVHNQGR